VAPAVSILVVVEAMELVRVVVEEIGGALGLVVVLAVLARGCLLFGALAHDVKLLPGVLDDLLQCLLEVHVILSAAQGYRE
jgi:hypothetical protein